MSNSVPYRLSSMALKHLVLEDIIDRKPWTSELLVSKVTLNWSEWTDQLRRLVGAVSVVVVIVSTTWQSSRTGNDAYRYVCCFPLLNGAGSVPPTSAELSRD
ncbi:hypothetical protein RRG08_067307 [Elysia crispata]|uniref:Uncharacterized protein n=1 Tax=Elysia crispata TaxID=231223 RepID=A0AAE1DD53_9GAST|nr:hypothetical protein RRG08_067307 [Elysia crispata]